MTGDTGESTPIFEHSANESTLSCEPFERRLLAFVQPLSTRHKRIGFQSGHVIYSTGDRDRKVYFLEEGAVKISVGTYAGQSCSLELHRAPAVFGVGACASPVHVDTAVAHTKVGLRKIPAVHLLAAIKAQNLGSAFMEYLAARGAQQQRLITDSVACSAEERLVAGLLQVGRKLGRQETRARYLDEPPWLEELANVSETRSRESRFQPLRVLGQQTKGQARTDTHSVAPGWLQYEPLELDLVHQTLVVHGQVVDTTRYQFMMLAHMVTNAGRAISAEEFRLQLFRSQHERSSSNVRRQIHALRQLLESARTGLSEMIENVTGVGYGVGIRRRQEGA